MILKIGEIVIETGEIIYRDMSAEEIAKYEADLQTENERLISVENAKIEFEQKKQIALQKLAVLGLSVEDLTALGLSINNTSENEIKTSNADEL